MFTSGVFSDVSKLWVISGFAFICQKIVYCVTSVGTMQLQTIMKCAAQVRRARRFRKQAADKCYKLHNCL